MLLTRPTHGLVRAQERTGNQVQGMWLGAGHDRTLGTARQKGARQRAGEKDGSARRCRRHVVRASVFKSCARPTRVPCVMNLSRPPSVGCQISCCQHRQILRMSIVCVRPSSALCKPRPAQAQAYGEFFAKRRYFDSPDLLAFRSVSVRLGQ